MVVKQEILNRLYQNFPHVPTHDQENLFEVFTHFLLDSSPDKIFLLKGYAGTGKTSFVQSVVKLLPSIRKRSVLLAPTGRAAKVLSAYAGKPAHTIHRKIYFTAMDKNGFMSSRLKENLHINTLFIVDEASMISGQSNDLAFINQDLLADLIEYVYSGQNCHLMLIGDTAQLPPVHLNLSPALMKESLKEYYLFDFFEFELKEVVRQAVESGILFNATQLRNQIDKENIQNPVFERKDFTDFISINGGELQDALHDAYSEFGEENVVIITRSNKRANIYNREIRNRILFKENQVESGDLMMVVRNNYFWLDEKSQAGFIANGDIIEILQLRGYHKLYGFEFAEVEVQLIDYPEEPSFNTLLLLDTLTSESPSLSFEESNQLFQEVMKDYYDLSSKKLRTQAVKNNKYFNALQVKFANALTCHKTQGGQWDVVFLEQPWIPDDQLDIEMARWFYTALTRATQKIYLVNFKDQYFHDPLS